MNPVQFHNSAFKEEQPLLLEQPRRAHVRVSQRMLLQLGWQWEEKLQGEVACFVRPNDVAGKIRKAFGYPNLFSHLWNRLETHKIRPFATNLASFIALYHHSCSSKLQLLMWYSKKMVTSMVSFNIYLYTEHYLSQPQL